MNEMAPEEFSPEDARLIDLLVDGELDEARRKRLLRSLDEKPAGWRQCALAFLEAQSWGGSLKSIVTEKAETAKANEAEVATVKVDATKLDAIQHERTDKLATEQSRAAARPPKPWLARPVGMAALAASMLVAFILGIGLRNLNDSALVGPDTGDDFAQNERDPSAGWDGSLAIPVSEQAPAMRNIPDASGDNVHLIVDGDGHGPRSLEVPLIEDRELLNSFPFRHQSAIPAEVLKELEQRGHRVEHRRRLAPVQLPDGSRLLVPVEDVQIVPVKRQMY